MHQGQWPHVQWIDLNNDGILVECAVVKHDSVGNVHYIDLSSLDQVDASRMARLVQNRNAHNFPLWDLMSQTTLNNGINALDYFHQMVKVLSPDGVVYQPKRGVMGVGRFNSNQEDPVAENIKQQEPRNQNEMQPQQPVRKKKVTKKRVTKKTAAQPA